MYSVSIKWYNYTVIPNIQFSTKYTIIQYIQLYCIVILNV